MCIFIQGCKTVHNFHKRLLTIYLYGKLVRVASCIYTSWLFISRQRQLFLRRNTIYLEIVNLISLSKKNIRLMKTLNINRALRSSSTLISQLLKTILKELKKVFLKLDQGSKIRPRSLAFLQQVSQTQFRTAATVGIQLFSNGGIELCTTIDARSLEKTLSN